MVDDIVENFFNTYFLLTRSMFTDLFSQFSSSTPPSKRKRGRGGAYVGVPVKTHRAKF